MIRRVEYITYKDKPSDLDLLQLPNESIENTETDSSEEHIVLKWEIMGTSCSKSNFN